MKKVLNITNGNSAVKIMRQADIPGTFLSWDDVLHDGPVPAGLLLEELSKVRAQFIVECGWEIFKISAIVSMNEIVS
jgi:hypothetical protein